MSKPIFISYAHEDEEFAFKLASDLEARGADVWIDRGDISGGARWRAAIAAGIQACQVFILLVSPDAIASTYVRHELDEAEAQEKTILPLRYRKTRLPAELETRLHRHQFLDFRQGGYANNFADLVNSLDKQGVALSQAPELAPEELAQRRRERLGAPEEVVWKSVFGKVPGWALAWGLGWTIYWFVLPLLLALIGDGSLENFVLMPVGGFFGGLIGGLLAGLGTMLTLRHHAANIAWKHMSASIRIWGVAGPLGTLAAGGVAALLFNADALNLGSADCSALNFAECIGATLGQSFANALVTVFALVLLILLYVAIAVFVLGGVAGWLAVRHIRRLEPGILGRQSVWVILSWASGAVLAAVLPLILIAQLSG